MNNLRIGIYGFGSIGRLLAKTALKRNHELIGVVDIDEKIVGRDVGELLGIKKLGITVNKNIESLAEADVVLHATGSYLDKVYSQIASIINLGVNVVSTCETLAYPYYRYPVLARKLDELAEAMGVVVIGTGINPGFLLDSLLVVLSSTLPTVRKIRAIRSLDAAKRRESFRRKIGVGEDPSVVREKIARGELTGHVGYAESIYLIAYAGDLELSHVVEKQEPLVAEEPVESAGIKVDKGLSKGITGYGAGYVGDREVVRIEFHAYVGAPEYEEVTIESDDFNLKWRSTGTPGDIGTASIVLSIAEKINRIPPGLRLMTELLPFKIKFSV
ncbi:MAG: dihydrodipicolinate reductase [Desulfurococcaceae archaeon]